MTVTVASDCLLKAARAFIVFKAVEELGQIRFTDQAHRILRMRSLICHSAFMLHQVRVLINWSMQLPTYLRLIRLREKKSPSFTWRVKQSRQHRLLKRQKRQIRKEEKEEKTPAAKTESSKPKTANNSQKQAVSHKKLLQAEQSE